MKILHLLPRLTLGGAGRSALSLAGPLSRPDLDETLVSLEPAADTALERARAWGVPVHDAPGAADVLARIAAADVVMLHYWNTPALADLLAIPWPPCRVVVWLKVFGRDAPQALGPRLVAFADAVLATTPSTLALPALRERPPGVDAGVVPAIVELARVPERPAPHAGFRVGYVGSVDPVKLHEGFLEMSAAVRIPDLRVVVCGGGAGEEPLRREIARRGLDDRFEIRGWVEDVGAVLATLDVFGYPLCPDTYGTTEKSLVEAMAAGVPPVVFPHGGIVDLVRDGVNGRVVRTPAEYARAVEALHADPEARVRLGRAAARDVRARLAPERSADALHAACEARMRAPKRARPPIEGGSAPTPGARRFLASLDGAAPAFVTSADPQASTEARDHADRRIAAASPLLRSTHSGGILHYRSHHRGDPWLRFWSALTLLETGRPALARGELAAAAKLGLPPERLAPALERAKGPPASASRRPARRTLLFESAAGGHQAFYLDAWLRTAPDPARLALVVSPRFAALHRAVVDRARGRGVAVELLAEDETKALDRAVAPPAVSLRAFARGSLARDDRHRVQWEIAAAHAERLGVQETCFLYLDGVLGAAAAGRPFPTRFSGVYFRPLFHGAASDARAREQAAQQRFLVGRLLRHPQLATVFCTDPFAPAPSPRWQPLPDPAPEIDPARLGRGAARARLGLPDDATLLLSFGVLGPRKGLDGLLEATARLPRARAERLVLALVGERSGLAEEAIDAAIARLRSRSPVRVVRRAGHVDDEEKHDWFEAADVVAAAYRRHVGMSGVLLHAAAHRRPVLSQDYGTMGELVRRSGLGLTVDPDDPDATANALAALLADPEGHLDEAGVASLLKRHRLADFTQTFWSRLAADG